MIVKQIGLSWITVSDMVQAKKLYVETLGLEIVEENKEMGWLEVKCGNSILGIWQANPEAEDRPGQNAVLTFTVDDIVKARKFMEQKGIRFISEIMEMPGVFKMVTFVDADGNKCQLYESCQGQ